MEQPAATIREGGSAFAPLTVLARALARRQLSSRELVGLCLERIDAAQPRLNAFRVVCDEQAQLAADDADRRLAAGEAGPLEGIPVAIKDDVDLAGYTTPFGCGGDHDPAAEDAEVVRRLRAAGAIVIGKTNTPELGQWPFTESTAFGATRNPWNTERSPGGSSGGGAAAVAAGLVPAAIGSDGAGSIRIPAAWTGLVGLKPQRGRISNWPDAEAFNGLSGLGPLTRTVGDAALLLDVLGGSHPGDRHRPPPPDSPFWAASVHTPRRLRVALSFATPFGVPDRVDPEIRAATERTAEQLAALGHEVDEADPKYGLAGLSLMARGMAGAHVWLGEHVRDRRELEPRTRVQAGAGRLMTGAPLRAARAAERPLGRRMGRIFDRFDLVLTPTTAKPPPRIGALDGRGFWATGTAASAACPFCWAWNVVGWPAISVPAGFDRAGLPIGSQLLGPQNDEATLLAVAAQLETAGDWPAGVEAVI